jgi:hypothetical protein
MKRSVKSAVTVGGSVAVLIAGVVGGRAWAGGIPSKGALTYSGVLQKPDGSPLTSSGHNLEIKLWSAGPSGGTVLCDTAVPAPTFALDNSGRFSVQLDDTCSGAIGANAGAFVEILLDGNTLGRTKLGAVPYAIEANHAASADTAAAANAASGVLATTISSLAQASSVPKVTAWADLTSASIPTPVVVNATVITPITNATTKARWRRVGDSVQMRITSEWRSGPPNVAGPMFWTLPAGFLGNVSNDTRANLGVAYVWSAETTLAQVCQVLISGAPFDYLYAYCTGAAGQLATSSPVAVPIEIDIDVTYPVKGWTLTQ